MSYRANSKRRKRREIDNLVAFWVFLLEFLLEIVNVNYNFSLKAFFLVWSNVTFRRFWCFRRFRRINLATSKIPFSFNMAKFLFWNCETIKSRPIAFKFPLKTICSYKKPIKGKIFICGECCFICLNKY